MSVARAARAQVAGFPLLPAPRVKVTPTSSRLFTSINDVTKITLAGGNNNTSKFYDTTTPAPGTSGHLRFYAPSFTDVNGSTFAHTPASPLNLSASYLRLLLRFTGLTSVLAFKVRLADSSAAYTAGNYVEYWWRPKVGGTTPNCTWLQEATWQYDSAVAQLATVVGTGATLSSIGYVVFCFNMSVINTAIVDIAGYDVVAMPSAKAKCVIWHDDSVAAAAGVMATKMAAYGFPLTFATEVENLGVSTYVTKAQAQAYQASGYQHGSHAINSAEHVAVTPAQFVGQARRTRDGGRALGLAGQADLAAWGGLVTATVYSQVVSLFRSLRTNVQDLRIICDPLPPPSAHTMKALLVTEATDTQAGMFKTYVDAAIACKGLVQFVYHQGNATGGSTADTEFSNLLAYLDANRASIDVVTIDTALAPYTA